MIIGQKMKILSYRSKRPTMKLDIMIGGRWNGTLLFPCTPEVEYGYEELKAYARLQRPSLVGKDFELLPCEPPKFV